MINNVQENKELSHLHKRFTSSGRHIHNRFVWLHVRLVKEKKPVCLFCFVVRDAAAAPAKDGQEEQSQTVQEVQVQPSSEGTPLRNCSSRADIVFFSFLFFWFGRY
jgi:hypothetical protein